jgi:hypothetical protein
MQQFLFLIVRLHEHKGPDPRSAPLLRDALWIMFQNVVFSSTVAFWMNTLRCCCWESLKWTIYSRPSLLHKVGQRESKYEEVQMNSSLLITGTPRTHRVDLCHKWQTIPYIVVYFWLGSRWKVVCYIGNRVPFRGCYAYLFLEVHFLLQMEHRVQGDTHKHTICLSAVSTSVY